MGRIYKRCPRNQQQRDAGFVTFFLFCSPASHTPIHTILVLKHKPGLSVTVKCIPPPGINGLARKLTRTIVGMKWVKRETVNLFCFSSLLSGLKFYPPLITNKTKT